MCMLFVKPENFTLPRVYFDSLKAKNSDGLAFYNKSTKTIFKTLDYNAGWDYLQSNTENELVVHFRFGTSGENTIQQLHAFPVCNNEYLLFHNGVLNSVDGDVKEGLSDTQVLVNIFRDEPVERLVAYLEAHEKGSRFLIVDLEKNEYILPKCAKWIGDATIDGTHIIFSNSYAIDWKLLDSYKKIPTYNNYGTRTNWNNKITTGSSNPLKRNQDYYNDLFKEDYEDFDKYDDIEDREELIIELMDLMWKKDKSAAIDYIKLYPDVAHAFIADLMTKEDLALPF